jgi:hypothetical protein
MFEQLEPTQVEHLEGTPFGHALDLLTHIALYTNTLAYFSKASVRKKKVLKYLNLVNSTFPAISIENCDVTGWPSTSIELSLVSWTWQ